MKLLFFACTVAVASAQFAVPPDVVVPPPSNFVAPPANGEAPPEAGVAKFAAKKGGKKGGKFGKKGGKKEGKGGNQIEGLKDAVEQALDAGFQQLGLVKPEKETATKEEIQAFKQALKDTGFNTSELKAQAALNFVRQGEANGSISAQVAAEFYAKAADKELKQAAKEAKRATVEEMKNQAQQALAEALNIAFEDLEALKGDKSAIKAASAEAGVDLQAIKQAAVKEFLAAAVESGNMSEEEALKLASKVARKGAQGSKKGQGNGKNGGNKQSSKGSRGNQFVQAPPADFVVPPEAQTSFRPLPTWNPPAAVSNYWGGKK